MKPFKSLPRNPITSIGKSSLRHTISRRGITTQELDRTKGDRERVVILGSGWAGYTLSRLLSPTKFQPVVISPRSYFVFTPLLASTAVGTLEFRTTLEPVRKRGSGIEFLQGWADDVDFSRKRVFVEEGAVRADGDAGSVGGGGGGSWGRGDGGGKMSREKGRVFEIGYDKLVVAVGCYSQTFGTRGVKENALFLKDVGDARKIRKRILDCFETAALPSTSNALRKQLLNFAVVGGGPTGVEFSAELFDLCKDDMKRLYPSLIKDVRITIYDVAPNILSMFDSSLANYALETFRRDGITVKTSHHIEELRQGLPRTAAGDAGCLVLKTKEDGEVGIGMCVWSTGLMMNPFIQKALADVHTYPTASAKPSSPPPSPQQQNPTSSSPPLSPPSDPQTLKWALKRHPKTGGLMVDDRFRVKIISQPSTTTTTSPTAAAAGAEAIITDVFALGDVAVMEKAPLPATAQVANQESKWLARRLNQGYAGGGARGREKEGKGEDIESLPAFAFRNLGIMTYIGGMRAVLQTGGEREIRGRTAWLIWRGAYLTQTISWRNKILIPIYWAINWIFGRDISRF